MCRWLAYSGTPLLLEQILFEPEHSLIDQSLRARVSESTTNGDGFGVGWYGERESPGLFKDVRPAWNDPNLRDLAAQVRSGLFLAHVRAATGSAIQRSNSHPFRHGRWLFVHNGLIPSFSAVRRELLLRVAPDLFSSIEGTTDSELMFYLALTYGLERDVCGALARMVRTVETVGWEAGIEHPVQMTLGLSDGEALYAVRYSTVNRSRTLFHSGSIEALTKLVPEAAALDPRTRAIVSEPINELDDFWVEIPESTAVTIRQGEVITEPFAPQAD